MMMKRFWIDFITVILLAILLPALFFNTARILMRSEGNSSSAPTDISDTTMPAATVIRVQTENGIVPMALEEYITGVVHCEMPANFEPEALKAQAVVARTYALRMRQKSGKHPEADVCAQSDCCQGYTNGENEKIRAAVAATAGQVLTYDGALIEATYFSSAGGRTEDALAVWGNDIPYLQSTDSPEYGYQDQSLNTVTMTAQEFQTKLGLVLEGPCETWLSDVAYTKGGGVATMSIGGHIFDGTDLRKLLELRSTAMVITAVGDHITITTRGYGHRVGMSQYGAEAMAVSGATYDEILAHYYQGTTLELFVDKE